MGIHINDIRVGRENDRRVKITDKQRKEIIEKYNQGGTSYVKLAKEYGVTKPTIMFIINPETRTKAKESLKKSREANPIVWTKEQRNMIMKEHRDYKRSLVKSGAIAI